MHLHSQQRLHDIIQKIINTEKIVKQQINVIKILYIKHAIPKNKYFFSFTLIIINICKIEFDKI